jgi:hypothetical protein
VPEVGAGLLAAERDDDLLPLELSGEALPADAPDPDAPSTGFGASALLLAGSLPEATEPLLAGGNAPADV